MIRAVIIDDELNNISNLNALLRAHCSGVAVVATATCADKAREYILQLKPDVIFLDIYMPDESGFDLLRSLDKFDFEVVFVSAYDEYGLLAIKFSALDYLLKPININELKAAVSKIEKSVDAKKRNTRLENLFHLLDKQQHDINERIALSTLKETHLVPVKNIIRCESSNNYTTFFLLNGTEYVISKPIYEYEELLKPYGFIRCHQSHLVNKIHVQSILNEDSGYLILEGTTKKIPISKQKKNAIKSYFK